MRKFFAIIISVLLCISAAGQNVVSSFANSLHGQCASFDYSYSMSGSLPMSGSGAVKLQDNAFTMMGNGLDIRCDGKTRWTTDVVAEECYIEDVTGQGLDYEANPALLVGAVDKAFTLMKTSNATFNGAKVTEASLKPQAKGGNIASVSLFLASGNKPVGANITTTDGNVITIIIKNFKLAKPVDMKEFSLDTKTLEKSYIITDLR